VGRALVEDTDEVDDGRAIGEQLTEHTRIVHIGLAQLRGVEHAQPVGACQAAGWHPHPVSRVHEPRHQLRADETGTAEHADVHECEVPQRSGTSSTVAPRRTSSTSTAAPRARSRSSCTLLTCPRLAPTITSSARSPAWAAALPGSTLRTSAPPASGASPSTAPSKLLWMLAGPPV